MSGRDWFWENYKKGMGWINHHQVAFWKSHAIALKAENEQLKETIDRVQSIQPPVYSKIVSSKRTNKHKNSKGHRRGGKKSRKRQRRHCEELASVSEEFDVQVSPELIEFFRISIKHKEQRRKEKEEQEALSSFVPPQDLLDARVAEMEKLYGEGSAKIVQLEKAMTLNFEKFVDRKCPEVWSRDSLNLNLSSSGS